MPDDVEHDNDWGPALSEQFAKADTSAGGSDAGDADGTRVQTSQDTPSEASGPEGVADADAGRERDAEGRFVAKKPGAASSGTPPVKATSSGAQAGAASGAPPGAAAPQAAAPVVPPAPVLKPPQSWKPAVRELAAKLPPEFRPILEEAVRRDREAAVALQARAEAEKGAGAWGEVVRPYEAQFRQAGVAPEAYVGDLLRTAHALTYGNAQQQGEVLAGIILQYGGHLLKADSVDEQGNPSAPLDRMLVARMRGQQAQPQQAPQPQFDKEALLQEVEQRMQATVQQRVAEAELVKIAPELEYIEDLKDDMARLFEAGLATNYKEAYALALQLPKNSDTLGLVRQKEAATSAANAQASTQRARAASSSVSNKPGGAGGSAPPGDDDDWDAHLNASWDRAAAR